MEMEPDMFSTLLHTAANSIVRSMPDHQHEFQGKHIASKLEDEAWPLTNNEVKYVLGKIRIMMQLGICQSPKRRRLQSEYTRPVWLFPSLFAWKIHDCSVSPNEREELSFHSTWRQNAVRKTAGGRKRYHAIGCTPTTGAIARIFPPVTSITCIPRFMLTERIGIECAITRGAGGALRRYFGHRVLVPTKLMLSIQRYSSKADSVSSFVL